MEEQVTNGLNPLKRKKPARPAGNWCVMLVTENLFVTGDYRPLAVELLKQIVPGGARRFYRTAGPEFFANFRLSAAQVQWLSEARFFNGTWEVLREYRRPLLDALSLEYPQVWLVENGESSPFQVPENGNASDLAALAPGPPVIMPLTWARSYTVYCHRHRAWELDPCRDSGRIVEQPAAAGAARKKWPGLELHAPENTLVRASRKQVSYYLARPGEPQRLGRDADGEAAARRVIETQRLALVLRAGQAMTRPPDQACPPN